MLQSDLCYYSDAYIVVKGAITVEGANNIDTYNRNLLLENNARLISCISKTNSTLITDNAEDLDIAISLYNLLEYSVNYANTSGNLWNYFNDIAIDSLKNFESLKYKTSITGKTANDENTKEVEFSVPLKHLSNFWRTLDTPLIN